MTPLWLLVSRDVMITSTVGVKFMSTTSSVDSTANDFLTRSLPKHVGKPNMQQPKISKNSWRKTWRQWRAISAEGRTATLDSSFCLSNTLKSWTPPFSTCPTWSERQPYQNMCRPDRIIASYDNTSRIGESKTPQKLARLCLWGCLPIDAKERVHRVHQ